MSSLWDWWNLIYLIPLIVALIYLSVSVVVGAFEGSEAHVHGVEHDADAHLDHELDHELDHDLDHAIEAGGHHVEGALGGHEAHTSDHATHHEGGPKGLPALDPLALLLMAIGAKNVTAGFAVQVLMLCWGLLGLVLNSVLARWLPSPALFVLPSILLTGLLSIGVTRAVTSVMGRIFPSDDSAALSRQDLEGSLGVCLYEIDSDSGVAIVRDRYGSRHQVACRTNGPTIARNSEVVLVDYYPQGDYFLAESVAEFDAAEELVERTTEAPATELSSGAGR